MDEAAAMSPSDSGERALPANLSDSHLHVLKKIVHALSNASE
jgi:hypothetical protein